MRKTLWLLNGIAFLLAFSSLSYELLIATKLSRLLGEGIFVYPGCLGVFILFMGLGSFFRYRQSQDDISASLKSLIFIEFQLVVLGYLSILFINVFQAYVIDHLVWLLFLGLVIAGWIGYLTGQELPLIFRFCGSLQLGQKQIRTLLLFDYLASFFSSVAIALYLFPTFGIYKSSIIISFCNFLAIPLILVLMKPIQMVFYRMTSAALIFFMGIYAASSVYADSLENHLIRNIFSYGRNIVLLEKKYTRYQQVLLFMERKDGKIIRESTDEIEAHPENYNLWATLNGSTQFFNELGTPTDAYHTYLVDPFVALIPETKDVLILVGGDGLPARQLLRHDSVKRITMVDIDGEWVDFTRKHPFMRLNSHEALSDPRVNIHISDAFRWVARAQHEGEAFDMILIDFPESVNLAAIRVVSIQFMHDLKRILKEDGVIVVQNDFHVPLEVVQKIWRTAAQAGLHPILGFRTDDTLSADRHIVQYAMFKNKAMMELYLNKYKTEYLKSAKFRQTLDRYGHIHYAENVPDTGEWISYYHPGTLDELLRFYLSL